MTEPPPDPVAQLGDGDQVAGLVRAETPVGLDNAEHPEEVVNGLSDEPRRLDSLLNVAGSANADFRPGAFPRVFHDFPSGPREPLLSLARARGFFDRQRFSRFGHDMQLGRAANSSPLLARERG